MNGDLIDMKRTGLAVIAVLCLSSCAPEQKSQVLPEKVVGLEPVEEWSNSDWQMKLPAGWIVEPVFGMRDASFRVIGAAGSESEVSISRLPIKGGTLASNVNRWRVQAGLEPWEEGAVIEQLTPITISDHQAYRMEFPADNETGQTIYGVIMEEGEQRTFIKFSGPAGMMKQQLEAWNYFVENLEVRHAH